MGAWRGSPGGSMPLDLEAQTMLDATSVNKHVDLFSLAA
jgi:hypothetical protein